MQYTNPGRESRRLPSCAGGKFAPVQPKTHGSAIRCSPLRQDSGSRWRASLHHAFPVSAGRPERSWFTVNASRSGKIRPILTITNEGDSTVSLLAVRVAALDESGIPRAEWTEVVATPIAADGAWRGPIMPGGTRNVIMRGSRHGLSDDARRTLTPSVEISDLFVWESGGVCTTTVNAG